MKRIIFLIIPLLVLILGSCDPETGILSISGNCEISLDSNPRIGIFPASVTLTADYNEVQYVDDSYVPLVAVIPDAAGDYVIDFPGDLSSVGQLIAWDDGNSNGIFEVGSESDAGVVPGEFGLFPIKTVKDIGYVITGWDSVGDIFYVSDGDTNLDLSSVGTQGFDFFYAPR